MCGQMLLVFVPKMRMGPLRKTMKVYTTAKTTASDVISLQHDMTDINS